VSREKLAYDRREDYGHIFFFIYINHPFEEETNCARPGARGEAKITVWCGQRQGWRGVATFLKAAGGIKALQIHFARVSLLPRLIANNSHIALGGYKAEKNRRKRGIRDTKA